MNPPRHGTINGYRCDGCRCDECREAKRVYERDRRAAYIANGNINHGVVSSFDAGCRCDLCRQAKSDAHRRNYRYVHVVRSQKPPEPKPGLVRCWECGGFYSTKLDGTLWPHGAPRCAGAGLLPNGELPPPKPKRPTGRPCPVIDLNLAAALLVHRSVADVAKVLGVSDRTLQRRIRQHSGLAEAHKQFRKGKLVHGTENGYNHHKCRCQICRDSHSNLMRRLKLERIHRAAEAPHGTESGYINWNCRCEPCKKAGSIRNRAYRLKRLEREAAA